MTMSKDGKTTTLHLILAWGFVGVPLVWGLLQTIEKAMQLLG
jgi:hypothetical protein